MMFLVVCAGSLLQATSGGDHPKGEEDTAQTEVATGAEDRGCGAHALYVLLRLEGKPAELTIITSHLGATGAAGLSMSRLKAASAALGLALKGVRLDPDLRALDRPVIAYVELEGHGHFLVLRPIGHTGKLVQLIDSARPDPEVYDFNEVIHDPRWTGLLLVPERQVTPLTLVGSLLSFTGLGLLGIAALSRHRRRARTLSGESPRV